MVLYIFVDNFGGFKNLVIVTLLLYKDYIRPYAEKLKIRYVIKKL